MTTCSQASVVTEWAKQGSDAPPDTTLTGHLQTCPACHELFHEISLTRRIAADVPTREVPAATRDQFRFALMAEARRRAERPRSRWPAAVGTLRLRHRLWLAAALAAVSVVAFVGWLSIRSGVTADGGSVASVVLLPGARGSVEKGPPDEIYRLSGGTADFTVRKVAKEQRYRVLAGDGTVEVRGTRFRLEVVNGRLEGVEVTEGQVWVWLGTSRVADITKGGRWTRGREAIAPPVPAASTAATAQGVRSQPVEPAKAAPSPSSDRPPPESPARPESSGGGAPTPNDAAFAHAWELLRRGDTLRAAGEFDTMLESGTFDAARRADVLYWAAQAYSRAGRPAMAEARARRLVSEFAGSFRAADAALMVGEMTLARGERGDARQWFRRAAGSTHPSVRTRAEKALRDLGP